MQTINAEIKWGKNSTLHKSKNELYHSQQLSIMHSEEADNFITPYISMMSTREWLYF